MSGRLHVVHVLHSLGTGGMERGLTNVIRHASDGFEHTVLCLLRTGDMARLLPDGTRVVEMNKAPGNSPRFVWRLSRTLKQLRPDVVHTRNWGGMDGVIAARVAGLRQVVHGEHGWDMADPEGRSRKRRLARRWLSRWVSEYTCVSCHIERWLREEVRIKRPITQIYNGVDTEALKPAGEGAAIRNELGIPEGSFVAGFVGRLDPIKDHPTLFRALAVLRERGMDARLLVVGEGPEEERLRELAGEGVDFLGNRTDVPRVLQALDLFVLSSLNEGISNTILEAMATGLPVVATRVGGNTELVEDGVSGRLVAHGDTEAFVAAIREYQADPVRSQAHGEAGRRATLDRFSIEAMVKSYEEVWTRVVGGS